MRIVITGPRSVGKTAVSRLVAEELGLKYISSDEIGEKATKKQGGLDNAIKSGHILEIIKTKGYPLILAVFKKDNFVFDLSGGSVSSKKIPEASKKVRDAAKKRCIVIGLLPFKNKKDSINLLFAREKHRKHFKEMDNKELLDKTTKHFSKFPPLLKTFCNHVIYTNNRSPDEITEEIIRKIKS